MATANKNNPNNNDVLLFSTLSILQLIKDSQQQHGLRHGDYLRYRAYCTRKLRRVRKSLHFTNIHKHKGPFQAKKLTPESVSDVKCLLLPLFAAERCWAYAMQLKQEANSEPRKKFHLHSRLRKAVRFSLELESLCKALSQVDARTKLEAQAYNAWLRGYLHYELQAWDKALEFFGACKLIYEKLCSVVSDTSQSDLYRQRCAEVEPHIRFCRYNIGDETGIADIMKMRLTMGTESEELENLIAQTMSRQSQEAKAEVKWCSHAISLEKPLKARTFYSTLQSFEKEIDKIDESEAKLAAYERLLIDCRDAIQAVRDEAKGENLKVTHISGEETALSPAQLLHSYLCWVRLSKTIERYLVLIENTLAPKVQQADAMDVDAANGDGGASKPAAKKKKRTKIADASKAAASQAADAKKQSKPQDLVRLYDTVLQNFGEIEEIPGVQTDVKFLRQLQLQTVYFKAFRSFHVAEAFGLLKKWRECVAMCDRALEYAQQTSKDIKEIANSFKSISKQALDALIASINTEKYTAYANSLESSDVASGQDADVFTKPLTDDLNRYYNFNIAELADGKCPPLIKFPPDFKAIPCKPLFFDLALNHVQFPSLDHRVESTDAAKKEAAERGGAAQPGGAAAGGISGLVKGWFWGGGNKK